MESSVDDNLKCIFHSTIRTLHSWQFRPCNVVFMIPCSEAQCIIGPGPSPKSKFMEVRELVNLGICSTCDSFKICIGVFYTRMR